MTTDFGGGTAEAASQPDGKLVAAGFAITQSGSPHFALARYRQ